MLEPVRARMVALPAEYRWSSDRAHAQAERNDLLQAHPVYACPGAEPEAPCAAYRELFRYELEAGTVGAIRQASKGNFAPGDARFGRPSHASRLSSHTMEPKSHTKRVR